jgi:hypothetical protein
VVRRKSGRAARDIRPFFRKSRREFPCIAYNCCALEIFLPQRSTKVANELLCLFVIKIRLFS